MPKKHFKVKFGFRIRLKLAWKAFCLEPYKIELPFYEPAGQFKSAVACDNKGWKLCDSEKVAKHALYKPAIILKFEDTDTYFLCEDCVGNSIGKKEKLYESMEGKMIMLGTIFDNLGENIKAKSNL